MRKLMLVMLVIVMSVLLAIPATAQETNSPSQNWCYDGGPLAGKCDDPDPAIARWMWLFGFYGAQIANGTINISDIPEEFQVSQLRQPIIPAGGESADDLAAATRISGTVSTCKFNSNDIIIDLIIASMIQTGDRFQLNLEEGSITYTGYIPIGVSTYTLRFGKPSTEIAEGGILKVYYRGVLVGYDDDLNGLNECEPA